MTKQISETLLYEGETAKMHITPLHDYFTLAGIAPNFLAPYSSLWRGYVGRWEIIDGRLYLIGLRGTLMDHTEASVATFFPDFPDRAFAHWYSGTIRITLDTMLEHVHEGVVSTQARDVVLEVERGVVKHTEASLDGEAA
jgi:hypothetical protein